MTSLLSLPLASNPDWAALAATNVPAGERILLVGRRDPIERHLAELEGEFRGDPQLHYYHAALSALIRRNIQRELALQQFEDMWRSQPDCLLRLSLRWLISACDTLMDHAPDLADRTAGAAGSLLGNVVKLYETERRFSDVKFSPESDPRNPVPLFDGLTTFSIGFGDMIFNQRQRFAALVEDGSFAHRIVGEIIRRLDANDTVFARLAAAHLDDSTRWA